MRRLRERAERALDRQRPDHELMRVLDELVDAAPRGSDDSLFAHRQLAELRLERHPWRAALHLKAILDRTGDDEGANALMGLCQALLGNYRAAAFAYRRALRIAPQNPWYHHNLGHLLDVGLGDQRTALHHLKRASELEPHEDEITASLARCLAALGRFREASALIDAAVCAAPDNEDHRALREWILRRAAQGDESDGSPSDQVPGSARNLKRTHDENALRRYEEGRYEEGRCEQGRAELHRSEGRSETCRNEARRAEAPRSGAHPGERCGPDLGRPARPHTHGRGITRDGGFGAVGAVGQDTACEVLRALEAHMVTAGFSPLAVRLAHAMWTDFQHHREGIGNKAPVGKPEVVAAAVEYALAKIQQLPGVTQAAVARRYGVAAASVANRYGQIRQALSLQPKDPRYIPRA